MAVERTVKLKLVSGERYSIPAISDDVILKGGTVMVTRAQADALLEDFWADSLNNEHKYFEEVDIDYDEETTDGGDASGNGGGGGNDDAPDSAPKTPKTAAPAKAPARTKVKPATK